MIGSRQLSIPMQVLTYLLLLSFAANLPAENIENTQTLGPVRVTTKLSPSDPVIGDEVVLEIRVEADTNVEVLMPEFQEALQRYSISEFVPTEKVQSDGSTISAQTYTLQPASSGEQTVYPLSIEFVDNRPGKTEAPEGMDAYEILTERIDFTVASVLPSDAANELMPPLGELETHSSSSRSTWIWSIAGVIAVVTAIAAAFFWSRMRNRAQRRNAYEIARTRLDNLLGDQNSENPALSVELFFVEISGIIRKYLEHRFQVKAPDLTTDEFLQLSAATSELSREHQSLLSEFLKQADIVKFAGVQASANDVKHSGDLAIRFLEDTRENAPDVEVEPSVSEQDTEQLGAPLREKETSRA